MGVEGQPAPELPDAGSRRAIELRNRDGAQAERPRGIVHVAMALTAPAAYVDALLEVLRHAASAVGGAAPARTPAAD